METEKSHSDSEVSGDRFKRQSPAASDEPMAEPVAFKHAPRTPRTQVLTLQQGNIVFPAINRADVALAEALINNCSFHYKRELDVKEKRSTAERGKIFSGELLLCCE